MIERAGCERPGASLVKSGFLARRSSTFRPVKFEKVFSQHMSKYANRPDMDDRRPRCLLWSFCLLTSCLLTLGVMGQTTEPLLPVPPAPSGPQAPPPPGQPTYPSQT